MRQCYTKHCLTEPQLWIFGNRNISIKLCSPRRLHLWLPQGYDAPWGQDSWHNIQGTKAYKEQLTELTLRLEIVAELMNGRNSGGVLDNISGGRSSFSPTWTMMMTSSTSIVNSNITMSCARVHHVFIVKSMYKVVKGTWIACNARREYKKSKLFTPLAFWKSSSWRRCSLLLRKISANQTKEVEQRLTWIHFWTSWIHLSNTSFYQCQLSFYA